MGRWGSVRFAIPLLVIVTMTAALSGCGSSATKGTAFPVPASIKLSPAETASMEVGSTLTFAGAPQNSKGVAFAEPVSYQSSNPAVLTIASNGLACAGTWNSLGAPQICTPGPVGTAQVVATSMGVSSPPTTVYVHQHIDSVVVSPVPTSPPTPPPPCISKGLTANYQASAFSRGTDITATVGTFTWQTLNSAVATPNAVTLSNPVTGLLPGQMQATAVTPGMTSIFASISGVNSVPVSFTTCPVQSITLTVNGSSSNPVIVSKGGSKTITATVLDTLGATITGTFLTWSSSDPAIATVTGSSSGTVVSGAVATSQAGGASIIASCTPPTCNIGILPILPIYPESVVDLIVTPTSTTQSSTVYVASTGCGTIEGCVSATIPITTAASTTSPGTTVGAPINLPATPNSLVFDRQGKNAYLGTDRGELGTKGLMMLSAPATVSEFTSVTGKVLAVSPDGNTVIVSDTLATPNQVFIFTSNGTSHSSVALNITGATAADFSPDNLKAYIVADAPCPSSIIPSSSCLYIYSTLEALQNVQLIAPATDVSFLPVGAFVYLAGGSSTPAVTTWTTCTSYSLNSLPTQTVPTPATPSFIKALPNDTQVLAVDPPGIDLISVSTTPVGCPPTVSNGPATFFNLGQGNFTPTQLIVTPDGSTAYVISGSVPKVIIFNISGHTSSSIALTGGATPIRATLTPDGTLLYVAANDGQVHLLNTVASPAVDFLQISFPPGTTSQPTGLCSGVTFTCLPDLIAVRP
jgi:trimeric autotransporter adhesin